MTNARTEVIGELTQQHIESLRKAYGTLEKIDPATPAYIALVKLLDVLPQEHLLQLAEAQIKFVSPLAKNRIRH